MSSTTERALLIPEVLGNIAYWIPLFEHDYSLSIASDVNNFGRELCWVPHHLLPFTLVSRFWNTCFTPFLYHYFVQGYIDPTAFTKSVVSAFHRNRHHIRRYLIVSELATHEHGTRSPFETRFAPGNLVGLSLHSNTDEGAELLLQNQGPQLRQLAWHDFFQEAIMRSDCQDALMNLPCLEELDLSGWIMTNELVCRTLRGCSGTLRVLKMKKVSGFDEGLFLHDPSTDSSEGLGMNGYQCPMLPKLKSLDLTMPTMTIQIAQFLPKICPALEAFCFNFSGEEDVIARLTSALREHCPNLHTIRSGPKDLTDYPMDQPIKAYASLFKVSCSTRGLRCATAVLPIGLDNSMMDAFLFHASTLVTLELECNSYNTFMPASLDMAQVVILLSACGSLKEVRLASVNCKVKSMEALLDECWLCRGLEVLIIEGYIPRNGERIYLEPTRKRVRQNMWQLKFQHHEYSEDGQGWFLRPGLGSQDFFEALADGDWKRGLFKHMYRTSGVRNAKYVRLNKTEFFAQEWTFDNVEVEWME